MSAAQEHLAAIAGVPRSAGGSGEDFARAHCAKALRDAGFEVTEYPFEYSAFPGRWGTPIGGAFAAIVFLVAGDLGAHAYPGAALGLLIAGAAVLGIFARYLGGNAVLDFRYARARSTNLVATRGAPSLWLVAHLDSKSQPVAIGVRAIGVLVSIAMWIAASVLALVQHFVAVQLWLWIVITLLGLLASIPVALSFVGARSPGALDDASGVVTVLRTAELLPLDTPVGVLLTSAEELGLAGARAWARESASRARGVLSTLSFHPTSITPPGMDVLRPGARPSPPPGASSDASRSSPFPGARSDPPRASALLGALNIDGVDDTGDFRLIYSGTLPRSLLAILGAAWPAPRRLPPGVLMDGVALAEAGWPVLNITRGNWRTVRRIHTPDDDLAHLDGSGAEELAAMLAGAIIASRR